MIGPRYANSGVKFYMLAANPNKADMLKLGFDSYVEARRAGYEAVAVGTASKRCPKKGEWFLSGAIPQGYKAPNDLGDEYNILRLMLMRGVMSYDLFARRASS